MVWLIYGLDGGFKVHGLLRHLRVGNETIVMAIATGRISDLKDDLQRRPASL
jgi:hypothetical protein